MSVFKRLVLAGACALAWLPASALAQGSPGLGAARYPSELAPADIARLSAAATHRSIIILKDQHPDVPATGPAEGARAARVAGDQAPLQSELARVHATNVRTYKVLNAVSATISPAEAGRLAGNPAVQAVVPDLPIKAPAAQEASGASTASPAAQQQVCAGSTRPLLQPEALGLMRVENQPGSGEPAARDLMDGTGTRVAWLADGIDIGNPDFQRGGKSIFVDYQDFTGEGIDAPTNGAEAFGDASSIAAQGSVVYSLNQFVNRAYPVDPGCTIRVEGVAPGAGLVGLKVFGRGALALTSSFLQAIDRAVTVDKVDVINESFGANPYPDPATDPIALADTAATRAGVTVVASSGDAGPNSTIGTPSDAPGVIGVGASTQLQSYRQTTAAGSQLMPGGWISDNISSLSSGGFTQFGPHTVDALAPGDLGWAVCSADLARYSGCLNNAGAASNLQLFGGTSEAAPLTAGTAALVIEAYEHTHGGARPDPQLVKRIIVSSATDLDVPAEEQGAGLVDALKAVQLAMSIHDSDGTPAPRGQSLLVSQSSLSATGRAGSTQRFTVQVTNTGRSTQTVRPAGQDLEPALASNDAGSLNLDPAAAPAFVDGGGVKSSYMLHQFQVPAGVQRLDASVTWNGVTQPTSRMRETLFDPHGRLAAYTLPQGPGGFSHVDVHDPAAGTWTALFWTRENATAYRGAFQFSFTTRRFQSFGTVSPASLALAPGAAGSFTVTVELPEQPGDLGGRLLLGTGQAGDGVLPITLRSLVPVDASGGTFQGILTGGNGRPIFGGQTLTFQFDVPPGRPSLNLALTLRDPDYNLTGLLVDPGHEPLDVQSTASVTSGAVTRTIQFFRRSPRAGRWTAVLVLNPPLNGGSLAEPFTARIDFASSPITAAGLPQFAGTVLPAGKPARATVTVVNRGVSQEAYFLDPRLRQVGPLALLGLNPTTVTLPLTGSSPEPVFLVPADTSALSIVANGSQPIQMDVAPNFGSPDVEGISVGNASVAVHAAPEVAPGPWFALPSEVGPFGTSAAPSATAVVGAEADANLFDTAVTSTTGDLWLTSITAGAPFSPLVLDPGQSATIDVTITPSAPRGTVVEGAVEVDTFNPNTTSGDEVISLPYAYTVG